MQIMFLCVFDHPWLDPAQGEGEHNKAETSPKSGGVKLHTKTKTVVHAAAKMFIEKVKACI